MSNTRPRLPTLSVRPTPGCASANARMSAGTNDSAAVVTAAMFQLALAQRSGLERGARAPLQQADHVAGKRREGRAGGGGADAAPVALEQCRAHLTRQRGDSGRNGRLGDDELVAAFVTEPVRTTARKLRSCVSVMDTTEDKL
jgi:hypothetical protein